MLSKRYLQALILLFAVAAIWCFGVAVPQKKDLENYKAFLQKSVKVSSSKSAKATDQRRESVRKDIWFAEEDYSRLHYRIDSRASTLTLIPNDDKLDIIESLEGIQCWMQDKFYSTGANPMQQVRYFEADRGTYQYTTQQFLAKSVALSLFRVPGQNLPTKLDPKTAFLQGIAQDVSFSVAGKMTAFQADRFKATLKGQNEGGSP